MAPIERWGTISDAQWEELSDSTPARGKNGGRKTSKDPRARIADTAIIQACLGNAMEFVFSGFNSAHEANTFAKLVRRRSEDPIRILRKVDETDGTTTVYVGPQTDGRKS